MQRDVAKVKSTGGFGFTLEDKATASFLVQLLAGRPAFGTASSHIVALHFQTRASGWIIDDVLLEMIDGIEKQYCAVSVKSAAYLTTAGFKSDFVADAWAQWRLTGVFSRDRDLMMLAVNRISDAALKAWEEIDRQARLSGPQYLADRLTQKGSSSREERNIFASLIPKDEEQRGTTKLEAAQLLSHLRVCYFGSLTDTHGRENCRSLLRIEEQATADHLWNELQRIASEYRVAGGSIGLPELLKELRAKYQLKDHPDFRGAWQILNGRSRSNCLAVRTQAGRDTTVVFGDPEKILRQKAKDGNVVAVIGESGTGKSSLVRQFTLATADAVNLVWLSNDELATQNQSLLAAQIGFAHEIPSLIAASTKPVLIVADALEQFSPLALRRLSEIVNAAASSDGIGFRIILTTQPLRWNELRREVHGWKARSVDDYFYEGPPFENVLSAVSGSAVALSLLSRPELRRVVTNLASLDQILGAINAQALAIGRGWVGETEIIDWVWEYWQGSDQYRFQRAAVLRLLGDEEATHGSLIPMNKVGLEVTALLGDSLIASLVSTDSHGVRFRHELVADWARYHVLKGVGSELHDNILKYVQNPRWMRAIRLYSQSLLEQSEGLINWEKVFGEFGSGDAENQVAADIFSDSLLLATNSKELLLKVWPSLIAGSGKRLKRLLKRLMTVGTLQLSSSNMSDDLADLSALMFRYPVPVYWEGIISALSLHADDVASHAISEAAEASAFYLRSVPGGYGRRRTVGKLVLRLTEVAQEGIRSRNYSLREASKHVFEALLRAAQEFPDEVERLGLILAERSPLIEGGFDEGAVVYSTGFSQRMLGRKRDPWPDGPQRRVEEPFREAVMKGDALLPLMKLRPAVASEMILAMCIEEPQTEYNSHQSMRLGEAGFSWWRDPMPAMYFTGPYLLFLRVSPRTAIDMIIRLVDFATDRWLEGCQRLYQTQDVPGYVVILDGQDKLFIGDGNVFNWNWDTSMAAAAVESALMALEKWFYDRLDTKEDITADVVELLSRSKSAAIIGLLTSVGLYAPGLFRGPLRSLFSNLDVYTSQRSGALSGSWDFLFGVRWGRYGKSICDEVRKWNEMPHRKYDLFLVARHYLITDSAMSRQISVYRKRWEKDAKQQEGEDGELPPSLELQIAQLDKRNYKSRELGNGQVEYSFKPSQRLETKLAEEQKRPEINLAALTFPTQASKVINEGKVLGSIEAIEAYDRLRMISEADIADETFALYKQQAMAAAVAMLIVDASKWLDEQEDAKDFCLSTWKELIATDAVHPEFDSSVSITDGQDYFLAVTALELISQGGEPPNAWATLLKGVMSFHYDTTEKIMLRAYSLRSDPRTRFYELCKVVLFWSAIRGPVEAKHGGRFDPTPLKRYQDLLIRRFERGYFSRKEYTVERLIALNLRFAGLILKNSPHFEWFLARTALKVAQTQPSRKRGRIHRRETFLDLELLSHGFGFLGKFEGLRSQDASALKALFDFLLALEMSLVPDSPRADTEEFENQYGFDHWIMAIAAVYYVALPPDVGIPMVAARVLGLGAGARRWIEDFLHAFFEYAASICPDDPKTIADRWSALIDVADASPRWRSDKVGLRYEVYGLYRELLGFSGYSSRASGTAFENALLLMMDKLEVWCSQWLSNTDSLAAFAYFVSVVKNPDLHVFGLQKIADNLPDISSTHRRDGELNLTLLAAVQHLLKDFPDLAAPGAQLSFAFQKILSFLTALLVPEAIDLQSKIAQSS
jgi:hypothetical protein